MGVCARARVYVFALMRHYCYRDIRFVNINVNSTQLVHYVRTNSDVSLVNVSCTWENGQGARQINMLPI